MDLSTIKEVELLQAVAEILLHPGPISEKDYQELIAINQEFQRRNQEKEE